MATVVDTLITRFTIDATGYQQGAKGVVNATQGIISKIGAISGAAGLLSAGGIIAFAVNSAVKFDTLTRSLTAVTQSASRARDILSYVDKLAVPSIFTSQDLAEAATTLEAFALTTERFLPIAEKLGTVFGGTATDLKQFVNALGMIKGGRTGEGMEALARAGISRDALKARGMQFNKGGEFLGDVKSLLDAVEAEVNARFGKLSQEMAQGPAAKLASLMDSLQRAARQVGGELLTVLVPAAEQLADAVAELVNSGKLQEWTAMAIDMGQTVGGVLLNVANFINDLPGPLKTAAVAFIALRGPITGVLGLLKDFGPTLLTSAKTALTTFAGFAKAIGLSIGVAIIAAALYIADGMKKVIAKKELQDEAYGRLSTAEEYYTDGKGHFIDPKTGKRTNKPVRKSQEEIDAIAEGKKEDIKRERAQEAAKGAIGILDDPSKKILDEIKTETRTQSDKQTPLLEQIAENTGQMVEGLKQYIFGGGNLGKLGVGQVEMTHSAINRTLTKMQRQGRMLPSR